MVVTSLRQQEVRLLGAGQFDQVIDAFYADAIALQISCCPGISFERIVFISIRYLTCKQAQCSGVCGS